MSQHEIRESYVIRSDGCYHVAQPRAAFQDGKHSPAGSFIFRECLIIGRGKVGVAEQKLHTSALLGREEG